MTYVVKVDRSLCSSFGSCEQLAPGAFRLEADGAVALVGETDDPHVLDAARSCPMGAIIVQELARAA
jgi:ferredoxin